MIEYIYKWEQISHKTNNCDPNLVPIVQLFPVFSVRGCCFIDRWGKSNPKHTDIHTYQSRWYQWPRGWCAHCSHTIARGSFANDNTKFMQGSAISPLKYEQKHLPTANEGPGMCPLVRWLHKIYQFCCATFVVLFICFLFTLVERAWARPHSICFVRWLKICTMSASRHSKHITI